MLKIAQKKKKVKIRIHNLRDWTNDRHKTADDKPYGGGSGMVMKVEPICKALTDIARKKTRIILLTPKGKRFNQEMAKELSCEKHVVCIAGHYEGIDERVKGFVTDEVSIGDYILTGGEIPAMVIVDAITRLIPGVLGGEGSLNEESFEKGHLEYPQYTRPRVFQSVPVPEVLLSGDHKRIKNWRKKKAIKIKPACGQTGRR